MTLDSKTSKFNVVINKPNNIDDNTWSHKFITMLDRLSANGYFYATITHNCDTNAHGELKTKHDHIVIMGKKLIRLQTMLYRLADYLDINDVSCISIDSCNDVALCIQYLTHKNNADKYQYQASDILTNLNPMDFHNYYFNDVGVEITTPYLYNLIRSGKTNIEIMFIIGLGRYHMFKGAIDDIRHALDRYSIAYLDELYNKSQGA